MSQSMICSNLNQSILAKEHLPGKWIYGKIITLKGRIRVEFIRVKPRKRIINCEA